MRMTLWAAIIAGLAGTLIYSARSLNGEPSAARAAEPVKKPFGLEKRELWTTSKVHGSPEPPAPYRMTKDFPKVKFTEPLELTPVPGKKAWVVAERGGKIITFANDPATTEKQLVLDVQHTVYGVVLHPKFQDNGFIYLSELPDPANETPEGTRLVRYTVADRAKMTADPATAKL